MCEKEKNEMVKEVGPFEAHVQRFPLIRWAGTVGAKVRLRLDVAKGVKRQDGFHHLSCDLRQTKDCRFADVVAC